MMSLHPREEQILASIKVAIVSSDPRLAALMTTFIKLAAGEDVPLRETLPAQRRIARRPNGMRPQHGWPASTPTEPVPGAGLRPSAARAGAVVPDLSRAHHHRPSFQPGRPRHRMHTTMASTLLQPFACSEFTGGRPRQIPVTRRPDDEASDGLDPQITCFQPMVARFRRRAAPAESHTSHQALLVSGTFPPEVRACAGTGAERGCRYRRAAVDVRRPELEGLTDGNEAPRPPPGMRPAGRTGPGCPGGGLHQLAASCAPGQ